MHVSQSIPGLAVKRPQLRRARTVSNRTCTRSEILSHARRSIHHTGIVTVSIFLKVCTHYYLA